MQNKEWAEELKRESDRNNYPQWPNEVMLKVLFGSYLKNKFILQENADVLDIGCFFGNNFFVNVEVGEITEQLMKQTLGFYIATGEKN